MNNTRITDNGEARVITTTFVSGWMGDTGRHGGPPRFPIVFLSDFRFCFRISLRTWILRHTLAREQAEHTISTPGSRRTSLHLFLTSTAVVPGS